MFLFISWRQISNFCCGTFCVNHTSQHVAKDVCKKCLQHNQLDTMQLCTSFLILWIRGLKVPPKRQHLHTKLHVVTDHNTLILIVNTVSTSRRFGQTRNRYEIVCQVINVHSVTPLLQQAYTIVYLYLETGCNCTEWICLAQNKVHRRRTWH